MYLELPARGYDMNPDPKSIPKPLKRFFETGLLTEDHVRIYREYNDTDADKLFLKKYAEIQEKHEANILITDNFLKNIVAYESWVEIRPSYSDYYDHEIVSLTIIGYVRAYIKSGLYVEIIESVYTNKNGEVRHEYDADMGRL